MSPIDKLKGKPVPELTTEALQGAGVFGVVVPSAPRHPRYGETWVKPSAPVPTVVTIMTVDAEWVSVRLGNRPTGRIKTLTIASFLEQGFRREDFLGDYAPAVPQMPKVGERGSIKPVDERISDAFERLLRVAKEDEDLDLVAVLSVVRALWMADATIIGWRALATLAVVEKEAGDADHK